MLFGHSKFRLVMKAFVTSDCHHVFFRVHLRFWSCLWLALVSDPRGEINLEKRGTQRRTPQDTGWKAVPALEPYQLPHTMTTSRTWSVRG